MTKKYNIQTDTLKTECRESRCIFESPVGRLLLTADEKALTGLELNSAAAGGKPTPILEEGIRWLGSYFSGGTPSPMELPLAPGGSIFQRRVWDILLQIPRGETLTYGAIARMISPQMSAQAVGNAAGANPIPIIIPCHRVVAAAGIGGYAYGIEIKRKLLAFEKGNSFCEI